MKIGSKNKSVAVYFGSVEEALETQQVETIWKMFFSDESLFIFYSVPLTIPTFLLKPHVHFYKLIIICDHGLSFWRPQL